MASLLAVWQPPLTAKRMLLCNPGKREEFLSTGVFLCTSKEASMYNKYILIAQLEIARLKTFGGDLG